MISIFNKKRKTLKELAENLTEKLFGTQNFCSLWKGEAFRYKNLDLATRFLARMLRPYIIIQNRWAMPTLLLYLAHGPGFFWLVFKQKFNLYAAPFDETYPVNYDMSLVKK